MHLTEHIRRPQSAIQPHMLSTASEDLETFLSEQVVAGLSQPVEPCYPLDSSSPLAEEVRAFVEDSLLRSAGSMLEDNNGPWGVQASLQTIDREGLARLGQDVRKLSPKVYVDESRSVHPILELALTRQQPGRENILDAKDSAVLAARTVLISPHVRDFPKAFTRAMETGGDVAEVRRRHHIGIETAYAVLHPDFRAHRALESDIEVVTTILEQTMTSPLKLPKDVGLRNFDAKVIFMVKDVLDRIHSEVDAASRKATYAPILRQLVRTHEQLNAHDMRVVLTMMSEDEAYGEAVHEVLEATKAATVQEILLGDKHAGALDTGIVVENKIHGLDTAQHIQLELLGRLPSHMRDESSNGKAAMLMRLGVQLANKDGYIPPHAQEVLAATRKRMCPNPRGGDAVASIFEIWHEAIVGHKVNTACAARLFQTAENMGFTVYSRELEKILEAESGIETLLDFAETYGTVAASSEFGQVISINAEGRAKAELTDAHHLLVISLLERAGITWDSLGRDKQTVLAARIATNAYNVRALSSSAVSIARDWKSAGMAALREYTGMEDADFAALLSGMYQASKRSRVVELLNMSGIKHAEALINVMDIEHQKDLVERALTKYQETQAGYVELRELQDIADEQLRDAAIQVALKERGLDLTFEQALRRGASELASAQRQLLLDSGIALRLARSTNSMSLAEVVANALEPILSFATTWELADIDLFDDRLVLDELSSSALTSIIAASSYRRYWEAKRGQRGKREHIESAWVETNDDVTSLLELAGTQDLHILQETRNAALKKAVELMPQDPSAADQDGYRARATHIISNIFNQLRLELFASRAMEEVTHEMVDARIGSGWSELVRILDTVHWTRDLLRGANDAARSFRGFLEEAAIDYVLELTPSAEQADITSIAVALIIAGRDKARDN